MVYFMLFFLFPISNNQTIEYLRNQNVLYYKVERSPKICMIRYLCRLSGIFLALYQLNWFSLVVSTICL